MKIGSILKELEKKAPSASAYSWDNVGLLAGDPEWDTKGAVATIDLDHFCVETCLKRGFSLIITHHPVIFPKNRGLSKLTPQNPKTDLILKCVANKIAIVTLHTNLDSYSLEPLQEIADLLSITPKGRLRSKKEDGLNKLVVFVPEQSAETVRKAIGEAGAGHIGNYSQCSFRTQGIGTFLGGDATRPVIGKQGQLEEVKEVRLETVMPLGITPVVVQAMLEVHPYEEVAYDVYRLTGASKEVGFAPSMGIGFWGEFSEARSFSDVTTHVKRAFQINGFRLTPSRSKAVEGDYKRIAFSPGSGNEILDAAVDSGSQLLITGEVGYHEALEASRRGLVVMELGHRESEAFTLAALGRWASELGLEVETSMEPTQSIEMG